MQRGEINFERVSFAYDDRDTEVIRELDLNPIRVGGAEHGCVVLDARVRVEPPAPTLSMGARLTG